MNNILEVLKQGENALLVVSAKDLKEFADSIVNRAIGAIDFAPVPEDEEKLYTAKEVCEMLHVNVSTLWRWQTANYLVPVKIGAKRFYREADIKKLSN